MRRRDPVVEETVCRVCGQPAVAVEFVTVRTPFGSSLRRPATAVRVIHKGDLGVVKAVPVRRRRMLALRVVLEDSCQARREQAA